MSKQLAGLVGTSPTMKSFTSVVRAYLRDDPELNRLVAGYESGDRFLMWAVLDAIAWFNGTPHFTNYSLDGLLKMQQGNLLLRMTAVTVVESVGLLQTRNHINYSNGGLNVGVNDKTPLLMGWLQYFRSTIDQRLQQVKVAINITGLLDGGSGVHSELLFVNSTYLAY